MCQRFPPLLLHVLLFFSFVGASASTILHTLNLTNSLKDGDVLISEGSNTFALGFFSPTNSTHLRYLGIWYYKIPVQTVVWVANRDRPITTSNGILSINNQGNLVLSSDNSTVWSTKQQQKPTSSPTAKANLLDSGNFVLLLSGSAETESRSKNQPVAWQSFDYPTHVFLPGMKLGLDRKSGLNRSLTSWVSDEDPATGNYSFRIDPDGSPEFYLYKGDRNPVWRTGPWVGQKWSGVPEMTRAYIFNYTFVVSTDEIYVSYGVRNASIVSVFELDGGSGTVRRRTWHESSGQWVKFWSAPGEDCDEYAKCGPYGLCNPNSDQFECSCFPGYHPKSPRDWFLRDGSEGCTRDGNLSMCRNGEGFLKLTSVKVPNTSGALANMSISTLEDCENECLKNCSCTAYTSAGSYGSRTSGCILFDHDLVDTREYSEGEGQDVYFRVDAVGLAEALRKPKSHHTQKELLIILPLCAVLIFTILISSACWFLKKKREWRDEKERSLWLKDTENQNEGSSDLPVYDLNTIITATQNFSSGYKLGEGGFGAVYKGILSTGQEIAVKRLSKNSGQGIQEFKNEVRLIAKLQHRNLVKTVGCCVRGEEKMLIYEYLPNKSLDKYIFDEEKRSLLDWRTRYDIILGVARGVLYLHQDSRFKIIHRDLKASNVLLDAKMNPKISDFGMARIFGNDEIEANTNRVVGTYGYMSPEYAMHGIISAKADVFSFGVLLLEIISGKKNSGFYDDHLSVNLIGHVWELWKDGRAVEIVDPLILPGSLKDDEDEILRCIQIGLLCVQENAEERPHMLEVVFMLSNKTKVPSPKEPAFVVKGSRYHATSKSGDPSSSSTGAHGSVCDLTNTVIEAR